MMNLINELQARVSELEDEIVRLKSGRPMITIPKIPEPYMPYKSPYGIGDGTSTPYFTTTGGTTALDCKIKSFIKGLESGD